MRFRRFYGENVAGAEERWFPVIAPFVKPGGRIELIGEEGDRWRFVFDGAVAHLERAEIVWRRI